MTLILRSCLSGKAHVFLSNLPAEIKNSYRPLVDTLRMRFSISSQQPMWVSMLKGRQRQPSESIASYGDELSRLARKAYADLDYVAQERMALDQLYSVVSPELRLKCIERDCRTVDHAVAIIQTYEGVMGMTSSEESRKSRVRMVDTDNRYTRTETGEALMSDPDTCSLLKRLAARVEQLEK